jgi:hypothetical protein
MPAKGKSRISDAQRAKIAAGKVAGKPARQIAEEVGLGKSTVDHAVSDPRVSNLTLRLKHKDEVKLEQAWDLALGSILGHLKSKSSDLVISARRDLMRLLTLGDPPMLKIAPTHSSAGDCSLEELLQTYRAATSKGEK